MVGWLVVAVSTAGGKPSLRMQVWRKLKELGALYVQQSVCLLPAIPAVVREVRILEDRVRQQGGSARVLRMAFQDAADERAVIAELNAARDDEYNELLSRIPELRQELSVERQRGNVTFAELEESEADLERFRAWHAKIAARDYFIASAATAVQTAIDDAAADLAEFEHAALQADATIPPAGAAHLRAVE